MTPCERHDCLVGIAEGLWSLRGQIEELMPELQLRVDQKAAKSILTDLGWANENCIVIARHQIGEAMDDAMGLTDDGEV